MTLYIMLFDCHLAIPKMTYQELQDTLQKAYEHKDTDVVIQCKNELKKRFSSSYKHIKVQKPAEWPVIDMGRFIQHLIGIK